MLSVQVLTDRPVSPVYNLTRSVFPIFILKAICFVCLLIFTIKLGGDRIDEILKERIAVRNV